MASEFTRYPTIKPGHEDAVRETLAAIDDDIATRRAVIKEIRTIHSARHVLFDNGTRYMFASVFDGTAVFGTAYPDLTTQQIWKDQRVNEACQEVLDTPEFQELLDNPATKALRATPAFQKLLDDAAG